MSEVADNYVTIRIKASDTARPDLTDLKAQLDELGEKVETAKVDVDDDDATKKLLDTNAKLADLNRKLASPRITVAGAARAEAQIAAIKAELDDLGEDFRPKAELEGAAEVEAELAAIDAEMDRIKDKRIDPRITLEGAARTEAEIAAIDLEMDRLQEKADSADGGGIIGRILTGGEGGGGAGGEGGIFASLIGPLGLVVVPAIEAALVEVTGLLSGFAAAGTGAAAFAALAYPAFKTVEGAIGDTRAQLDKLSPDERGAVLAIRQIKDTYEGMAKAFQPDAFKVFNSGLQLAAKLLPDITPFAKTFADVVSGLLGQAGKFASSKGFADWLKQFHGIEGPALTSIGDGIGKVAGAIGKLLTSMSGKDVAHSINIAFDAIAGVINGVTWVVKRLMSSWDQMVSGFRTFAHDVASVDHAVDSALDSMRHSIASWAHEWAQDFDQGSHDVADWAHNVASWFDEVRANLARWADDVASIFTGAWRKVTSVTSGGVNDVKAVLSWFGKLGGLFGGWWDEAVSAVKSKTSELVSFAESIPGRIAAALAALPGLLFQAGVNAIEGLLHGMESIIGGVIHTAESWGHDIANALGSAFGIHFSEPSEATQMVKAGRNIPAGLAAGMLSDLGAVASAARRVAGAAAIGPGAGAAAGYGGADGQMTIRLEFTGSDSKIMTAMMGQVRAMGGDPRIFTKKAQFIGQ